MYRPKVANFYGPLSFFKLLRSTKTKAVNNLVYRIYYKYLNAVMEEGWLYFCPSLIMYNRH